MKTKSKRKVLLISLAVFIVVTIIANFAISIAIYESNFNTRYEISSWIKRSTQDFEGLMSQRAVFQSSKGQQLVGYTYYKENIQPKGVVVIAHGLGGGGHNWYLDVADYFVQNGYKVFAYDATGNDESEGDAVNGLPQGAVDIDYALQYVKSNQELKGLPIMLFGHSWGAYSVGTALNKHPDVRAAVMVAGFNKSIDMITEEGKHIVGEAMQLFVPFLSVYEWFKFGSYASLSAEGGFDKSDAGVMIIHSADDARVSYKNQYERFYAKYSGNARFKFVPFTDRGHEDLYYSENAVKYKEQLNKAYDEYAAAADKEKTEALKSEFMLKNLDKSKYFELDQALMQEIAEFYNSNL